MPVTTLSWKGYNLFGLTDPDLLPDGEMQQGLYIRLRVRFDETLFDVDDFSEKQQPDARN